MSEGSSAEMEARALHALKLRLEKGYSLKQIGEHFGCTKERARQMCEQGLQIETQMDNIWYDLPQSIRGALSRDGCEPNIDAVCRYTMDILVRVPAMGKARIARLQHWLVRNGREPLK